MITVSLPEGVKPSDPLKLTEEQARSLRAAISSRLGGGRPKDPDRCPCGQMTLWRAAQRGHRCEAGQL